MSHDADGFGLPFFLVSKRFRRARTDSLEDDLITVPFSYFMWGCRELVDLMPVQTPGTAEVEGLEDESIPFDDESLTDDEWFKQFLGGLGNLGPLPAAAAA